MIIGLVYVLALIGLNMVQAPIYARISDQVAPTSRATVSAAIGAGGVIGQGIGTLVGSSLIEHMELGFICAGMCALAAGVLSVVIAPREPSSENMPKNTDEPLWKVVAASLTPPLKNCASYQLYILQDYIGQDKLSAAASIQVISVITMIVSIIASLVAGPIADALNRRKAPIIVACTFFAIGLAMPWIFPTQQGMFLFGGIASFGYGMYLSVDQALNVDVLPNKETAGKDLGFMNIATCAGQAIGVAITSTLVSVLGSYTVVFPVAIGMTAIAAISVLGIKRVR